MALFAQISVAPYISRRAAAWLVLKRLAVTENPTEGEGHPDKAEPPAVAGKGPGDVKTPPGKKEYDVGRGKPPKAWQYSPGTSGNPKGRPKVRPSTAAILSNELSATMEVTNGKKKERITKEVYLYRSTINDAIRGDKVARKEVLRLREKYRERDASQAQAPDYSAELRAKIERMAERYREQTEEKEKREKRKEDGDKDKL
jgi:hypothetical protein